MQPLTPMNPKVTPKWGNPITPKPLYEKGRGVGVKLGWQPQTRHPDTGNILEDASAGVALL